MIIQPVMHGFLGPGVDKLVLARDMQHEMAGNRGGFFEVFGDIDAVISDAGINICPAGSQIGKESAEAWPMSSAARSGAGASSHQGDCETRGSRWALGPADFRGTELCLF